MSVQNNDVLYSIIEYLENLKTDGNHNNDNITNIITSIESEFNLNDKVSIFQQSSYYPVGLNEIFEAGVSSLHLQPYSESVSYTHLTLPTNREV